MKAYNMTAREQPWSAQAHVKTNTIPNHWLNVTGRLSRHYDNTFGKCWHLLERAGEAVVPPLAAFQSRAIPSQRQRLSAEQGSSASRTALEYTMQQAKCLQTSFRASRQQTCTKFFPPKKQRNLKRKIFPNITGWLRGSTYKVHSITETWLERKGEGLAQPSWATTAFFGKQALLLEGMKKKPPSCMLLWWNQLKPLQNGGVQVHLSPCFPRALPEGHWTVSGETPSSSAGEAWPLHSQKAQDSSSERVSKRTTLLGFRLGKALQQKTERSTAGVSGGSCVPHASNQCAERRLLCLALL